MSKRNVKVLSFSIRDALIFALDLGQGMSDSRNLFAGRFRIQRRFETVQGSPDFLATESDSGRPVVIRVVDAARIASFEAARGVRHLHLAEILEVMRHVEPSALPDGVALPEGAAVVVAELVSGRTLAHELAEKTLAPGKAVAWVLRLAEAIKGLHEAGSVHGAVSPWAVVAEPDARAIAPTLSQLVRLPVGAYCPPERLKGGGPSASDDVWALFATLYSALTGKAPFDSTDRDGLAKQMSVTRPKSLADHGLNDPVLSEILSRGLIGERRLRLTELSELCQMLDGWERNPRAMPARRAPAPRPAPKGLVQIVGGTGPAAPRNDEITFDTAFAADEEVVDQGRPSPTPPPVVLPPPLPVTASDVGTSRLLELSAKMPPLPPSMPSAPRAQISKRLSFNPFEKKRRVWPLVTMAALAGGFAVYVTVAPTRAAAPAAVVSPAAPAPKPRAVEKPKLSVAEERDACVRSHFPDIALDPGAAVDFVCQDEDFREVAHRLFTVVGKSAPAVDDATEPKGIKTAAGPPALSGLGWYELPATSMIRKSCCRNAPPVVLPETLGWCEQLQTAVRRVAEDSARAGDLAPGAKSFDKAVNCLFANRIARPYRYERPPSQAERREFQRFLSVAAISEARR